MKRLALILIAVLLLIPAISANTTIQIYSSADSDGYVARDGVSESFTAIRNGDGTNGDSISDVRIRTIASSTSNLFTQLNRIPIGFDTSSIPDSVTILSASVHMYGTSYYNSFSTTPDFAFYDFYPIINGTVQASYYVNGGSNVVSSSIAGTSLTSAGYNIFNITNLTTISKTGYTNLMMKSSWDGSNSSPTWSASKSMSVYFEPSETDGASKDPFLEVTYTTSDGTLNADFSATPLSGTPPLLVSFTDNSVYGSNLNTTCNWSFGDISTPYSSVCGDVQHLYSYSGDYSINYSITNDNGSTSLTRSQYVEVLSSSQTGYILPTQPKSVQFSIVDGFGSPLSGATVTANYIASSLPNTDISWLQSAFGVSESVADQMTDGSIAQTGVTASDGSLSFIMYPVIQYSILINNTSQGLNNLISVYPKDDSYTIHCPLTSQITPVSKLTTLANSTIYTQQNSTHVTFNILFQDTGGTTSGLVWNVSCLSNLTTLYTKDFGAPGTGAHTDSFTVSTEPRGTEYRAMYSRSY